MLFCSHRILVVGKDIALYAVMIPLSPRLRNMFARRRAPQVVTGNNKHTVHVYKWRTGELLCANEGHNGHPPQVWQDRVSECIAHVP